MAEWIKASVLKTEVGNTTVGSNPTASANFMEECTDKCQRLSEFMRAQIEIVQKHLDEHKYLRKMENREEALDSFIHDYGWLIRELYCTRICEMRVGCKIAAHLSSSGDLLRDHVKKKE